MISKITYRTLDIKALYAGQVNHSYALVENTHFDNEKATYTHVSIRRDETDRQEIGVLKYVDGNPISKIVNDNEWVAIYSLNEDGTVNLDYLFNIYNFRPCMSLEYTPKKKKIAIILKEMIESQQVISSNSNDQKVLVKTVNLY